MPDPIQFVNDDPNQVLADAISDYQSIANRTLAPADPEMLQINAFAYRLAKAYTALNGAANQNLISFATGPALEQLGIKFGNNRLEASAAVTTIQYAINAGAPTLTIPQGTQIRSDDGAVIFATNTDVIVASGTATVNIDATCTTLGIVGNNYVAGSITDIVDPIAYVVSAANINTSEGGSDEETDDQLRARIPLASASFSVAGPDDAYKYFALSANPAIVDVSIYSPVPGTVNVYPLLANGVLPTDAIIDEVYAILSDKKTRPLNDNVVVLAPTALNYSVVVNITLNSTGIASITQAQALANLNGYVNQFNKGVLGVDIVISEIIALSKVTGAYDVSVASPLTNIPCDKTQFAYCTGVTVNIVGTVDE